MNRLHFAKNRRGSGIKRVLMIMLLVVVLAAVVAVAVFYGSSLKPESSILVSDAKEKTVAFSLDSGTSYIHAVTDSKTIFFGADNVKIASITGALEQDMALKASNPILSTRGKFALIADKGSKTAYLFNGSRLDKTLQPTEKIIMAKTNSSGYTLFITEGESHKHSAIVMSPTGEEIFKWQSGSLYVVSADISNNSRDIALSTVSTDGGAVSTNVYMFNITKDKPFTNEVVSDEIFGVMRFDGSYLYCIGTAGAYIYNDYGKCISTISYNDRELLRYAVSDGTVALLFSDSSKTANGSVVCTYTAKGSPLGEFYLDSKADFLDLKDGTVAVDNNRVVSILDSKCREKFQLNTQTAVSDFLFLSNSSTAVGISATGAQIIEVKK